MVIAGIDIGSGTTKCVLVDEAGALCGRGLVKTKADFEKVAREALEVAREDSRGAGGEVAYVATTGLGRYAVPFRDIQITDLTGRPILSLTGSGTLEPQEFTIERTQLPAAGTYYLKATDSTSSVTTSLILAL